MRILEIPENNIKLEAKPLFRTWYDVVKSYTKSHYHTLNYNDCFKILNITYKNPLTIREILNVLGYQMYDYKEKQVRLTVAKFTADNIMIATRRLNSGMGRPPYQYESIKKPRKAQ